MGKDGNFLLFCFVFVWTRFVFYFIVNFGLSKVY